jgi:hypothetical protein
MAETLNTPRARAEAAGRAIPDLLAAWRAAERRLSEAPADSAEAIEAKVALEVAHEAYREAFELAVQDLPEA